MLDHIKKKQVETALSEEGTVDEFYLPHHAVRKEKQGKTKCMIVSTDPLVKTTHRL